MDKHFRRTAKLSLWAYLEPDEIKKKLRPAGYRNFKWIENEKTDTQCYLCTKDGFVYLTFRGSSTDADWQTNFDITLAPCKDGFVHKGFRDDARSVYFVVTNELPRHIIKKRKLIITGHSQGAGVACTFAIELLETNRDIEAVIHYGGPRVAEYDFSKMLDEKYPDLFHRFVNNNDLVTRIPLRLNGYRHFGRLHYFEEDGIYTDKISAWRRFLDRLKGKFDFGGEYRFDILNDHMPERYADLVAANF